MASKIPNWKREKAARLKAEAEKAKAINECRAALAKLLTIAQKKKYPANEQHEISSALFNIDSVVSGHCNRYRR